MGTPADDWPQPAALRGEGMVHAPLELGLDLTQPGLRSPAASHIDAAGIAFRNFPPRWRSKGRSFAARYLACTNPVERFSDALAGGTY